MNRRKFFAQAIAFVAALFTPKPKVETPPAPLDAELLDSVFAPQTTAYAWHEDGHYFYQFWPPPTRPVAYAVDHAGKLWELKGVADAEPVGLPLSFSRDAFTLSTPKLSPEEIDHAYDEVNAMIDRWAKEPLFQAGRIQL